MYWYYTRQGFRTTSFPLPFIGNLLPMAKSMKERTMYSENILMNYLIKSFEKEVPYFIVDFNNGPGILFISDPEVI